MQVKPIVMSNGEDRVTIYNLLIENVKSTAVKYLFEDLQSEFEQSFIKCYDFPLLYDILRLIGFYHMDSTLYLRYISLMANYTAITVSQHLDVMEITEKIQGDPFFQGNTEAFINLSARSVEAMRRHFLTNEKNVSAKGSYSTYIPYGNLRYVADLLTENEQRLHVVVGLFKQLRYDFQ